MNTQQLADKYNAWLDAHCDPVRTARGAVSTRNGLTRYEMPPEMPRLLGGSIVGPAEGVRKAEGVPANVRRAVEELVEAWDIEAILKLRRDQKLAQELRHALSIHREFGHAPDGDTLEAWAMRTRDKYDRAYETDAPLAGEALRLWHEAVPQELPAANLRRRELRAA